MKVILLKDVENLGKRYEVKEVKTGFARNFLLPQELAKPATRENLTWLERQLEAETRKAEEALKQAQALAARLDGQEVEIKVKVGDKGELFEHIDPQDVSQQLKAMGFDIAKSQVHMPEPVKALGEFKVKIGLEHNLEAEVTVIVAAEETPAGQPQEEQ